MTHDCVIRGGSIADGNGGSLFEGDIAITDGVITGIGSISGKGQEEIDARGRLVTPGFVDVHTHYDGQATWASQMQPSSWHGCTTLIMGNCGVGFAPCRPDDRHRLIRLMEGVEDIPFPVLDQGLPWNWESYGDYLDALAQRQFDVDIGSQLPHAALRVFVMGERGANREAATPDDIAAMARLAGRAIANGALGFSTSRTLNHRTADGQPTPTLTAGEDELMAIACALGEHKAGVLQFVSDFADPKAEFDLLRRLVRKSGRPLSFSLIQSPLAPDLWRGLLDDVHTAQAEGLDIKAQVAARPVGVLLGFELTLNPFSRNPHYQAIATLPIDERVRRLSDASLRAQLLAEPEQLAGWPGAGLIRNFDNMYEMGADFDYEPEESQTLMRRAAAMGITPQTLALDIMLAGGGRGMIYVPFLNYADGSLDPVHAMMADPHSIPGLSDGGAHVGMICDGSFPTYNLTHWTRDRTRGTKFSIPEIIKLQCRDSARALGLSDRGVIAIGQRADINVIDYDHLRLHAPEVRFDLPAGGRRLVQRADGYDVTMVAGQITYRQGQATGALPGRLVRGSGYRSGSSV